MDYSRRDFLKIILASIPVTTLTLYAWPHVKEDVVFVEYDVDDILLLRAINIVGGTKTTIHCTLDSKAVWKAVTLYDSEGKEWHTEDGKMWTDGVREVEVL